ncbi:hypothetical protein BD410DRAFT_781944 [Rickenella mellea]|uniref:UPF3 domain-containing protein n=1 Tax=Rickenella mellea TaxID=50990 RepID=A0A4Y7QLB2_9AGAM|nr:hypothetical protein BD410DRAFT_781944 [Rickenella mellea]
MAEQATKPKKSRSRKDPKVSQAAGQTERLKTVVRRLPPNLPEEIFWHSVQEWVTDETVTWKVFRPGKMRKKFYKENIPSRAYIAFKSEELLAAFGQAYDGHLFRDKAGNESYAIVEFAPCQKIPSEKKKVDPRNATIEQDEDYISFIQSLNAPPTKPAEADTLEALIAASRPPPQPESTPLLDALKAERSAAKDKEAILRNHAHYHQGSAPSTAKDHSKKGAAAKAADDSHGKKGGRGKKDKADTSKGASTSAPAAAAGSSSVPHDAKGGKVGGPQGKAIPKGPKAAREKKPEPEAKKVPTVTISTPTAHGESDQAGNAEGASPTTPRERRSRPVLGLASRQFEAALSGAGVPVGGGAGGGGGERRARREKEKKPAVDAAQGNEGGNGANGGAGQGAGSVRDNPGGGRGGESSRRGRGGGRGGGRRRDASDGESISSASHGAAPPILHRIDAPTQPPKILSRNSQAEGSQQQPTTPVTSDAQSQAQGVGRGRGGKHRGGGPDGPGHRAEGDGGGGGGGRGDGSRGRRRGRGRGM